MIEKKPTSTKTLAHRLTFSKKETPSLLSKHIHKWDQDRGEEEEEEEEQDRFISPETVPELLASNEPWIRNTYLKDKPIFFLFTTYPKYSPETWKIWTEKSHLQD